MIFIFPYLVVAVGLIFRASMTRKYKQPDRAMDLGEVVLAIILIYGYDPGVGFLLAESGFGSIKDGRLGMFYSLDAVETVQWMFLAFAASFGLFYAAFRQPVIGKIDQSKESSKLVGPVLVATIGLTIALGIVGRIWGSDIGNDYISSYTQLRSAPVLVQQFFGIASQLQLTLVIAAVALAVSAWPHRHIYVLGALVLNLALAVIAGGSRTQAFLPFMAYIVASSIYVKGFRVGRAITLGVPALILFLIAGILRGEGQVGILNIFQDGEFTATFITPIDLSMQMPEGFSGHAPFNLYTSDLLRFVPSQFLPFEKVSPAEWYVRTFYSSYYDAGGGFAFGTLSEAVLGGGIPEAFIRGGLLGFIFAVAANRLLTLKSSPLKIIVYIWLIVLGYQCYRDTTFSIAARMLFHLTPVLLFLAFLRTSRSSSNSLVLRSSV